MALSGASACLLAAAGGAAPLPETGVVVEDPGGGAVEWGGWLAANGPAAVLLWASWVPGSIEAIGDSDRLRAACREQGLTLVAVSVQEPLADSRAALPPDGLLWLHDRHGALLKALRVIKVPALVVVGRDGRPMATLAPTADAVAGWRRQ